MKFATIATALLGAAVASEVEMTTEADIEAHGANDDDDAHLAQLITSALAGAPPGEINEPVGKASDKENDK